MFTTSTTFTRRSTLAAAGVAALVTLAAGIGHAFPPANARGPAAPTPTAGEVHGPAAVVPLAHQPPAKLVVDPPLAGELANGVAVIQYRTENLRIVPVFGPAAAAVLPRVGHLHVTVDDAPWHWADASGEPVIVAPLPPGPHTILIELANANHQVLARQAVKFDVPRR